MTLKSNDRPSLYGDSPSSEATGDIFRLLDALDQTPSVNCYGRRIAVGLLLVVVALGLLVLYRQLPAQQSLLPHTAAPAVQGAIRHVVPAIAPAVAAHAMVAGSVAPIVYEEVDRGKLPADAGADPKPPAAAGAVASTEDAIEEGGRSHDADKASAPDAKTFRAASGAHEGDSQHAAKQAGKHAGTRAHSGTRSAKRRGRTPTKDGDVDLIAALLSRVSHADAARKRAGRPPADAKRDAVVKPAAPGPDERLQPNRDIVVPRSGESLASLVQRCRALGVVEGELCRIRICSGNWGKDPACATNSTASAN